MPPVNPQGSRTALITWTVVTSFLFVTATIFAIYFYVERSRVQQQYDTRAAQYKNIADEGTLASPEIAAVMDLKQKENTWGYNPSQSVLDVAFKRGENEAKMIGGPSMTNPETALTAGDTAIKTAINKTKAVKVSIAPDNLISAVNLLSDDAV